MVLVWFTYRTGHIKNVFNKKLKKYGPNRMDVFVSDFGHIHILKKMSVNLWKLLT